MGIECLEIAWQLEKKFSIKFNKGDLYRAFGDTAGTLCEFVWQKLQGNQPAVPDLKHLLSV